MSILSRFMRSTSRDAETGDRDFWTVPAWPGKPDQVRRLELPAEDPFLLSASAAAAINPEVTSLLRESEFEAAVLQNLELLADR